jgi:hypothetical protein
MPGAHQAILAAGIHNGVIAKRFFQANELKAGNKSENKK